MLFVVLLYGYFWLLIFELLLLLMLVLTLTQYSIFFLSLNYFDKTSKRFHLVELDNSIFLRKFKLKSVKNKSSPSGLLVYKN